MAKKKLSDADDSQPVGLTGMNAEGQIRPIAAIGPLPQGALCQEASVNSKEFYIPCRRPAFSVVQHPRGRDEQPYYMCPECTSHNVKNRGAAVAWGWSPSDPLPPRAELVNDVSLAPSEDAVFVEQVGVSVREFLKTIGAFFGRARQLEAMAAATLIEAEALAEPRTTAEDEVVQKLAKRSGAEKKEIEYHWGITTTVHAFHARLTAARKRATDLEDKANKKANDLHNGFVRWDEARVARERREAEEEAERRQQEIRARELAAIEADALKAEAASDDLSDRERIFVDLFFSTKRGPESAQRAGYKNPAETAKRLVDVPKIARAINAKQTALELRQKAEAVKIAPLDPVTIREVHSQVTRAPGVRTGGITTWTAEILDLEGLRQAALKGEVPQDILIVDPTVVNDYARKAKNLIDYWGGGKLVRAKSTTRVS